MPIYKMSDVIVLLPGITGSVLKKDGKVVWGYSAATIARALFTLGASMAQELAMSNDDPEADDLGDGIVADALMPDLHLLPGIWKIDGYGKIVEAIRTTFDVTEGKNFFPFPYDWRRDNRASARKLARAADGWLKAWRESSGNASAKLILVCHSMGGLVSRYFLECMEGWKDTKALVSFGTPYRGSLNALDGLSNGMKKGPLELSSLARQLTSLYQLLPVFECYDGGDGKLVRIGETANIPGVDAAKAAAALAFHREIEKAVTANQELSQYQSSGYRIHPVVGIGQETSLSARWEKDKVVLLNTYKEEVLGGDGTVPRVSAVPIERSDDPDAIYAATQHGSLQNADPVLANLIGILSGINLDLRAFRKRDVHVALEVEDVYFVGEPITVRARPSKEGVALKATLWMRGQGAAASMLMKAGDGDWLVGEFAPPAAGVYRVTIEGVDVETAEDCFVVVAAAAHVDRGGFHAGASAAPSPAPIPLPGEAVAWHQDAILAVAAERTLDSALRSLEEQHADWAVVVRALRDSDDVFYYAFRYRDLTDLAAQRPDQRSQTLELALGLHESNASGTARGRRMLSPASAFQWLPGRVGGSGRTGRYRAIAFRRCSTGDCRRCDVVCAVSRRAR